MFAPLSRKFTGRLCTTDGDTVIDTVVIIC